MSVKLAVFLQLGEGSDVPPHSGTVFCVNTLVPQTGKAVEGVWPGDVQTCALAVQMINKQLSVSKSDRIVIIGIKITAASETAAPFL
ncbi:MAG TPA: hypothetical protein VGD17_11490 [Chitinophagaceae bacterium]